MVYDVDALAGSTMGIVGTGVALGVAAGTAGMVLRITERSITPKKMKTVKIKSMKTKTKGTKTRMNVPNYWMR